MDWVLSATMPALLLWPKQQLHPLPPKPSGFSQSHSGFPQFPSHRFSTRQVPLRRVRGRRGTHTVCGTPGGRRRWAPRAPRTPARPAAQAAPGRLPPRAPPPSSPPPSCRGGLRLRGWPSQLRRRWPRTRGVSGCHSDCALPRPQQLSAGFSRPQVPCAPEKALKLEGRA